MHFEKPQQLAASEGRDRGHDTTTGFFLIHLAELVYIHLYD